MHSIKRNDLIFVTGPVGTGKSSLIRLAERTINKQMSTVNVSRANLLKNRGFFFRLYLLIF